MRSSRWLVLLVLILAACSPGGVAATTTTTMVPPPPATTTTQPATTTTTTEPTTTTTQNVTAAVDEAKRSMTEPTLSDGGKLEQNGAFRESTEGFNPFDDLEVWVYVGEDGEGLVFWVEGPAELVREVVIEFDAQSGDFQVVRDTSYVGDMANEPPPWAVEAQDGNTVKASDNPPPENPGEDRLGALIKSDIKTVDEFFQLSIWIYSGFINGAYDYAHYLLEHEELIRRSSDGVVAAAAIAGIVGPGPPPLEWIFFGG